MRQTARILKINENIAIKTLLYPEAHSKGNHTSTSIEGKHFLQFFWLLCFPKELPSLRIPYDTLCYCSLHDAIVMIDSTMTF